MHSPALPSNPQHSPAIPTQRPAAKALPVTCLSKGTGSAFKDGGLQGDGLKAVFVTAVVFGRACGAASTTLANEKTIEKTWNKSRKWF